MKERLFKLKSYQRGLALHISPDADMQELLAKLQEKFQNSRQFFGEMQIGLAFSGKELTEDEENAILDVIEENSGLQVVCLVGKDEKLQYLFEEAAEQEEKPEEKEEDPEAYGQFYRGTLKKGQTFETEHSVIVLGNVNPGAKVVSRRDVIVLGALLGEAHAGCSLDESEEEGRFVCALEFSPEKLKIGSYKYSKKPERHFWPDSHKKLPKIATLSKGEIAVNPITEELLGQLTRQND